MKLPVSLVVVTLNEEKNIARCLKSVPWASDIVVLDSGSKDNTRGIATNLGARVFDEPWRGFGAQKHRAVELAREDWVLCLDADEELSSELAQEIATKFQTLEKDQGYQIPRKSFYLGRWILHGGWYPDRQLRLFNRGSGQWSKDAIHERVAIDAVSCLHEPILHYVFTDIFHQIATNNRYSSLQAEQAWQAGQKFSLTKMICKPASKFIECYVWKRGFLDGLPGFFIAVGAAYSVFLRWGKIWEFQCLKKKEAQS